MNSKDMIADYIQTLTPPLEREAIYNHFRELDPTITRGDISRALREAGFVAKRMRGGDTPSGVCQRWVRQEPEKTEADETSQSREIQRATETYSALADERVQLVELVQKSVKLRKEIREQQKQLLLEMSQLVQVMYGGEDEES